MAVPTILSISPVSGPTRGQTLVEILGTGFQLPGAPPPSGPVPTPPPTVRVTFGGNLCPLIAVVSSARIIVQAPAGFVGAAVDVVVTNIDALGAQIGAETVLAVGVYTYVYPPLRAESALVRLIRTFMRDLKQKIIPEVVHTWSSDYYDVALSVEELRLAQFPALVLIGPRMPINRFYSVNKADDVQTSPSSFIMRAAPLTVDLVFLLVGISDKTIENFNFEQITLDHFNRTKSIDLVRDTADLSKGTNTYEMEFSPYQEEVRVSVRANTSNVRTFSLGVEIRGFDVEALAGLGDTAAIGKGVPVDDINVNVEQKQ